VRQHYANVVTAIGKNNLPLRLVAINAEVKIAGGVDYYAIVSAIESLAAGGSAAGASAASAPV
jgi:hypothetical protein